MNIEKISKKVNSSEYDFLRSSPKLGNNIILLTLGGSYSYGTNIDTSEHVSDLDVRGIYLNSPREILTMNCADTPFEDKATDTVIYPFKQMIQLLTSANPNVLEILGTKEEHLLMCNESGRMLRDNVNLFLSKNVFNTFGGYAIQQLRRLENALCHDSYPQQEKEKHIQKSMEKQIMTMNDRYVEFSDKELKIYLDTSQKEEYDKEIFIDLHFDHYPLRDFKNIYSELSQIITSYDKLNKRNNKKDEVHLLKHAMHLIRLLLMGTEILQGKGLKTYRENDREFLLDIRNGKYTYEEIFAMVEKYNKEFLYAKENTCLPHEPDYDAINEMTLEINKKQIS